MIETNRSSNNSTLLHSFVIFPMRKIIFGVRGCFPASHGQEMKDLIASRGRRPREAVNVHFQPKWGWKTASSTKNCFSHRENDKWMEYITFFDFAAYASGPPTTRFPLTGFPPSEDAEVTEVKWPRNPKWWKFLMKTCKNYMKSKIWPQRPRKWPLDLNNLRKDLVIFFSQITFLKLGHQAEKNEL